MLKNANALFVLLSDRVITQRTCTELDLNFVTQLNVTYQSPNDVGCACYVTPPSNPAFTTGGIVAQRKSGSGECVH